MRERIKDTIYPCTYTDEEFEEELRLSEASGNATDEEVKALFERYNDETLAAIADAKAERTIKCKDFEDYLEKVKE